MESLREINLTEIGNGWLVKIDTKVVDGISTLPQYEPTLQMALDFISRILKIKGGKEKE